MLRALTMGLGLLLAGQAVAEGCHLINYGTLPVEMVDERATTRVQVDGKEVRFLLDTGGFFNLMSRATAASLGLNVAPAPFGFGIRGLGGSASVGQTRIRKLGILDATLPNVVFMVGGTDAGEGLLGANLLDIADLEIDLAHGKMTLFKGEDCAKTPLAYWVKDGRFEVADTRPAQDRFDRRTLLQVVVNGTTLQAVLDSGAAATVITRKAAERAGIALQGPDAKLIGSSIGVGPKAVQAWTAKVRSFSVGTETIQNSEMEVVDGRLGDDTDVLLGIDFMLAHHLFVANSQRRLYFTYNGGRVFTLATASGAPGGAASDPGPALQNADDYALRGRAHLSRGEAQAAVADLDQAVRMAPDRAAYYLARAQAHGTLGQLDAAAADLDAALRLQPDSVDGLLARAQLRLQRADRAGATADTAAASTLAPRGSAQARQVVVLDLALAQPAAALPLLDGWIELHRDDATLGAALNQRCWARGLADQLLDDALKDCRKAIKRDGANGAYLDSLGLIQLRRQHYAESIDAYQQALAQRPDVAWSHYGLGLARLRAGQTQAGLAELATARRLDPHIEATAASYGLVAPKP